MMTVTNIRCALLPREIHKVGTRGLDRFAGATEQPLYRVTLTVPVAIACNPVTERDYAPFAPMHVAEPADLPALLIAPLALFLVDVERAVIRQRAHDQAEGGLALLVVQLVAMVEPVLRALGIGRPVVRRHGEGGLRRPKGTQ